MSVEQPFKPQRVRGVRLMESAAELGARWHHGALDRVERERRVVVTRDGEDLAYDQLVLALGAHPEREWHAQGILTYHGGRDGPVYRLLHRLLEAHAGDVVVVPAGVAHAFVNVGPKPMRSINVHPGAVVGQPEPGVVRHLPHVAVKVPEAAGIAAIIDYAQGFHVASSKPLADVDLARAAEAT